MPASHAIWYPTQVTLHKQSPSVLWTDLSGLAFQEPFFHHTVARARDQARESRRTALGETPLGEGHPFDPGVQPTAFIFHVSRCGSTLLCNILRALHATHVVAEPQPVIALLAPFSEGVWSCAAHEWEHKRNLLLRQMVHWLGQPPQGPAGQYIVKFTSYSAMRMALIRALWPEVPIVFLVRDPAEVVVSNMQRSPGWMGLWQRPRQARSVFAWPEDSSAMSREEFLARALGCVCQAASTQSGNPTLVMDYRDLIAGGWGQILAFLGMDPPDAGERLRIDGAMQVYSKSSASGKVAFGADGSAKAQSVTPEIREAVERWAMPGMQALMASPHWPAA